MGRLLKTLLAAAVAVALAGCSTAPPGPADAASGTSAAPLTTLPALTTTSTSTTTTSTTTTTIPRRDLTGTVTDAAGSPLAAAVVTAGDARTDTDAAGAFALHQIEAGPIQVYLPGWLPRLVRWGGSRTHLDIELEPRVVRGVRAIPDVAGDPARFDALLDLIEGTTVNALVFDTKDETGKVRYATGVPRADRLGAVDDTYDPVAMVEQAHRAGLYAITRIVTFEDQVWSNDPEAKLAGIWVNPVDRSNWAYPTNLAIEACELGFDEVQFDYVRFPAGETASVAQAAQPLTADQRVDVIRSFLDAASRKLHPLGCAVSAAIFGIVVSSPTDEGIGQRPEELSTAVDALSPMVYPSHYSPGWLGFADPNDHPAAVTADALDNAAHRVSPGTLIRPWLQAFYWSPEQIAASIAEADARGYGWILWNAAGNYPRAALPTAN